MNLLSERLYHRPRVSFERRPNLLDGGFRYKPKDQRVLLVLCDVSTKQILEAGFDNFKMLFSRFAHRDIICDDGPGGNRTPSLRKLGSTRSRCDPPPLKWSDLKYV